MSVMPGGDGSAADGSGLMSEMVPAANGEEGGEQPAQAQGEGNAGAQGERQERQQAAAPQGPFVAKIVPHRDTAPYKLVPRYLDLETSPAMPETPRSLSVLPKDGEKEIPPYLKNYKRSFAETATASERRQNAILFDGRKEAHAFNYVLLGARRRVQKSLDAGLSDLDRSYDRAQLDIEQGERYAIDRLKQIARGARAIVRAAEQEALAIIEERKNVILDAMSASQLDALDIEAMLCGYSGEVDVKGAAASEAFTQLAGDPGRVLADDGTSSRYANTEQVSFPGIDNSIDTDDYDPELPAAIAEELNPAVTHHSNERSGAYTEGVTFFGGRLADAAVAFQATATNAFQPFQQYVDRLGTAAPAHIATLRNNAFKSIKKIQKACERNLAQSRNKAQLSLARRHDKVRQQSIEKAQKLADSQAKAIQGNAQAQLNSNAAIAAAQGSAVIALEENIADQAGLPGQKFAEYVTTASANTDAEAEKSAVSKQKEARSRSKQTRDAIDQKVEKSGNAYDMSIAKFVEMFRQASAQSSAAMMQMAQAQQSAMQSTAEPVSKSIESFEIPAEDELFRMQEQLRIAIQHAGLQAHGIYIGEPVPPLEGESESPAQDQQPQEAAQPPARIGGNPQEFVQKSDTYTANAQTEVKLVSLAKQIGGTVANDVVRRSTGLSDQMSLLGQNPKATLALLRGMSALRGAAVSKHYEVTYGKDLRDDIWHYMNWGNFASGVGTRLYSRQAALDYLDGRRAAGALNEMRAAVEFWNDEDQVFDALGALRPEDLPALRGFVQSDEILASVSNDLSESGKQAFDLVTSATEENAAEAFAAARGIRMTPVIQEKLEVGPERGADQAFDEMQRVGRLVGTTTLEGRNEFGLDENFEHQDPADVHRERQRLWGETMAHVGGGGTRHEDGAAGGIEWLDNAVEQANYNRSHGRRYNPDTRQYEDRVIREEQRRLLHNIAEFGADAPETRAAQLHAEETRRGGAKRKRWENALHFEGGPAAVDEDGNRLSRREEQRRQHALDEETQQSGNQLPNEEDRMLQLYDSYKHGVSRETPRDPGEIRRELGESVRRGTRDERLGRLLESQVTKGLTHPDTAALAFEHAVDRAGTDEDLLRDTFGRMNRDQIDAAVARYDAAHPGESLYERLGLFDANNDPTSANYWMPELSGDDRIDIQVLAMGKPRDARERAEVARMRSRLQRDNASILGRLVAGDEYDRMVRTHDRMVRSMGVTEADFDERGRLRSPRGVPIGNFDENGNFAVGGPMGAIAFGMEMEANTAHANSYRVAIDNIANAVTTVIMIGTAVAIAIVAAVTTVFTGGGAAAFWVPALITLGGGLLAMGANAALKGGRYGYEDFGRDLGMTIVQAATAGIGGSLGAVAAGASKGLTGVAAVSRAIAAEAMVGAVAGGIGGAGNALFDDAAWDSGNWLEGIGDGFTRGMIGGAVGGAVTAGITRSATAGSMWSQRYRQARQAGVSARWARAIATGRTAKAMGNVDLQQSALGRVLGGGLGGSATRAAEIEYDRSRGKYHGSSAQAFGEIVSAGAQGAASSVGEIAGEGIGNRLKPRVARWYARWQARRAAANDNAPPVDADGSVTARPPQADDGDFTGATRPSDLTDDPGPARLPAGPDGGQPQMKLRSLDGDDTGLPPVDGDITREIPTLTTMEQHLESGGRANRPITDNIPLTPEILARTRRIPEHSDFYADSPETARRNYDLLRQKDPHREVLLAHNPETGEFIVRQGGDHSVQPPPAGWETLRHSHPYLSPIEGATLPARRSRSLPSGERGDFSVLKTELDRLSATLGPDVPLTRESVIDIQFGDQHLETHFAITKEGDNYSYFVQFRPPRDGIATLGPFRSIGEYEGFIRTDLGVRRQAGEGDALMTPDVGQSRPRRSVRHGDAPPLRQAADIEFFRQRMGMANDFEAQVAGLRPRGDIDPALGRHAALADAHQRVRDMGLVGEPDSMIRLHNIINDDSIPIDTRRLISDVTLEATRQQMVRDGLLAPGEPLIMLFHGATDGRARNIVEGGIDMSRRPGGVMDDFGEGLYFSQHLESAMVYARGRGGTRDGADGAVIPYVLRGRDFGASVDVSTGGPHRAQWEAFVTANQHLFQKLNVDPEILRRPETMEAMMRGEPLPFGSFDAEGRGAVFDAFLAHIGGTHGRPDIIFGDLGGPLTSGVQFRGGVTDQAAVRSQRIADILNEQHAPRRPAADNDNDSGPAMLRSLDGPQEEASSKSIRREPSDETRRRSDVADDREGTVLATDGETQANDVDPRVRAREIMAELETSRPAVEALETELQRLKDAPGEEMQSIADEFDSLIPPDFDPDHPNANRAYKLMEEIVDLIGGGDYEEALPKIAERIERMSRVATDKDAVGRVKRIRKMVEDYIHARDERAARQQQLELEIAPRRKTVDQLQEELSSLRLFQDVPLHPDLPEPMAGMDYDVAEGFVKRRETKDGLSEELAIELVEAMAKDIRGDGSDYDAILTAEGLKRFAPVTLARMQEIHAALHKHIFGFKAEAQLANAIANGEVSVPARVAGGVDADQTVVYFGHGSGEHHADVVSVDSQGNVILYDSKFHGSGSGTGHSDTFADAGKRAKSLAAARAAIESNDTLPDHIRQQALDNIDAGIFLAITAHTSGDGKFALRIIASSADGSVTKDP